MSMFASLTGRKPSRRSKTSEEEPPDPLVLPEADVTDSINDDQDDEGFASTDYARRCKELMALNKALRDMGAATLIDLPRIAVIGAQSAGKSSLVEAVSGINVPRDDGMCTRCPMECSMTSTEDSWSCVISLRFDYDKHGRELPKPEGGVFGPVIKDKKDVEIWLRRAQAAILSPHLTWEYFFDKTAEELRHETKSDPRTLTFSKNVVSVDIKDPNATNLSFVDLPGLIQNETEEMVDLVKNLVVSYIRSEKTLILMAIPISDDMENQQAVRLAREADPQGKRTIGVLTKPDTLTKGAISSRQKWKDVLQDRSHKLRLGYYCVRLPDDEQRSRNISHSEMEKLSTELFETTEPWSDVEDRGRFGIPNLVSNLSKLLIGLIEHTLPKLQHDVDQLLDRCEDDLSKLPAPLTTDPTTEILTRITAFCNAVKGAVRGEGTKTLAQRNRMGYLEWKKKIRGTAPDFRPSENHTQHAKPSWNDPEQSTAPEIAVEVFDLKKVREVIDNSIGWELPFNVPYEAKKTLILKFVSLWQDPTMLCFQEVFDNLTATLAMFVKDHFGRFTQLESQIEQLIHKEVDECKEVARKAVLKTLELEKDPLFTQNIRFLESERSEWLERYRGWNPYRNHCSPPNPLPGFEKELIVMAEVRAYFEVAYRRVIDYIPLTIEHNLCQALTNNLQLTLFQTVFTGKNLSAKELVSEGPGIAERRERLEERRKRLIEIKLKLDASRTWASARVIPVWGRPDWGRNKAGDHAESDAEWDEKSRDGNESIVSLNGPAIPHKGSTESFSFGTRVSLPIAVPQSPIEEPVPSISVPQSPIEEPVPSLFAPSGTTKKKKAKRYF